MGRGVILGSICVAIVMAGDTASGQAADEPPPGRLPPRILIRTVKGMPNHADGRLIAWHILELWRLSPTFREMLAVLEASPHVRTLVAPSTDIRKVSGLIGRTRFRVGPTGVVGSIEVLVDRLHPELPVEAIGHEFGHVVETACLGEVDSLEILTARLRVRALHPGAAAPGTAIETPFAAAIGKVVAHERFFDQHAVTQLAAVAARFGLDRCPSTEPAGSSGSASGK